MQFTTRTKEEIKTSKLIPVGVYPFEVLEAAEKTSKKGADMIELQLAVFDNNGNRRQVRDWLGSWNGGDEKILGFCEATGLPYDGNLSADDCLSRSGYLKIGIQKNDAYGDQNTVKLYVPEDKVNNKFVPDASIPANPVPVSDDDIPF